MELIELQIAPGISSDSTDRTPENRWKDCDNVRFRNGLPEKIGGHTKITLSQNSVVTKPLGIGRTIHDWADLGGGMWVALGTNVKLYLINMNILYDITPLLSSGSLTNPFSTTNLSNSVSVAHLVHGLAVGQHIHFTPASNVGGLNMTGEWIVDTVPNINSYTFLHTSNATSTAGPGGGTTGYEYEIATGPANYSSLMGWGAGGYGSGGYGVGVPSPAGSVYPRVWSLDHWGEDLVASFNGGPLYWWDKTNGTGVRAVLVAGAPASIQRIITSQEDRHLIAFGSPITGDTDPMLIRWSTTEDFNTFTATPTNTAGDQRLDDGSLIITAIRSREETLVFTDTSIYSMRFIGAPYVFGFQPLGANISIVGPNAMCDVNGAVYFMGVKDFFTYDGALRIIPCPISNMVFDRLNYSQTYKIICTVNELFSEITWHIPVDAAEENNFCVHYNYKEDVWYYRNINRSAFHGQSVVYHQPYGLDVDGNFYLHESGYDDDTNPMPWFIESWDAEISQGNQVLHISKLIPDFKKLVGDAQVLLKTKRYPGTTEQQNKGPYVFQAPTTKISVRARGRQAALRVFGSALGTNFRMGQWRAEVTPHGKR